MALNSLLRPTKSARAQQRGLGRRLVLPLVSASSAPAALSRRGDLVPGFVGGCDDEVSVLHPSVCRSHVGSGDHLVAEIDHFVVGNACRPREPGGYSVASWSYRRTTMRNNTGVFRTPVFQGRSKAALSRC